MPLSTNCGKAEETEFGIASRQWIIWKRIGFIRVGAKPGSFLFFNFLFIHIGLLEKFISVEKERFSLSLSGESLG
jgi:hypothetical protein